MSTYQQKRKIGTARLPWHPTLLAMLTFLLTPLVATVALAFNWLRFNKPLSWVWTTIFVWVSLPAFTILAMLLSITMIRNNAISYTIFVAATFAFIVAILLYPFMIAAIQRGAYLAMKQDGAHAAATHRYSWSKNIGLFLCLSIGFGSCMGYIVSTNPQEFHQVDTLTFALDTSWTVNDNPEWRHCQTISRDCAATFASHSDLLIFVIEHTDANLADTTVSRSLIPADADAAEPTMTDYQSVRIGQCNTMMSTYRSDDAISKRMVIYTDDRALVIGIDSTSQATLDANWDAIKRILDLSITRDTDSLMLGCS